MRSRRERVCFSFVPCFPEPNENKENIVIPFGLDWHAVQPIFLQSSPSWSIPCGRCVGCGLPEAPAEAAGRLLETPANSYQLESRSGFAEETQAAGILTPVRPGGRTLPPRGRQRAPTPARSKASAAFPGAHGPRWVKKVCFFVAETWELWYHKIVYGPVGL